jgi:hypothetical protein
VIGVTFNDNLNSQFVRLARHTFGVKLGFVSVDALDGDRAPEHVSRHGADVLFAGPHDQERWDVRCRQGDVEVVKVGWTADPAHPPAHPPRSDQDRFVMLTLERAGRVRPMSLSVSASPRKGDQSTVAVAKRERDKALAELAAAGWQPIPAVATTNSPWRPRSPGGVANVPAAT